MFSPTSNKVCGLGISLTAPLIQETLRWTISHVDTNVYISEMKLLPREIKSNLSPRLQHLSPRWTFQFYLQPTTTKMASLQGWCQTILIPTVLCMNGSCDRFWFSYWRALTGGALKFQGSAACREVKAYAR